MFRFPLQTDVRFHNPLPWGPGFSLAHHSISSTDTSYVTAQTPTASRYCPIWTFPFGLFLKTYVTSPLTLVSFSNRCGTLAKFTPLQGPASPLALVPFFNRCGTLAKSTPLTDTPPRVYSPSGNNLLVGT